MSYHKTVLLKESIEGLDIKPEGIYVDVTFGGGGHSREILKRLKKGKLIAFDQDEDAIVNSIDDERFSLVNANFRFMKNFLLFHLAYPVDGIIADLGISSHQIDNPERGFSIRFDTDLDLRMDRKNVQSAKSLLAEYSAEELSRIFFEYGELNRAKQIANTIVRERKIKEIKTTEDLKNILGQFAERGKENKFYSQVFQALRIEINSEIEALKEFLLQSKEAIKDNGRLVVISYHSLEDRLVKNFMKSGNFEGVVEKDFYGNERSPMKMITKRPITPDPEEINDNNRARSAKLRIAVKNK